MTEQDKNNVIDALEYALHKSINVNGDSETHYNTLANAIAVVKNCSIPDVSESTLGIPDIRNKLSPITHLISMVERNEPDFIKKAIPQAKESVNYLAQRDVYSR